MEPIPPQDNQPQLCLGLVRHTRLRPLRHAFAYRVYQLRLPLRSLARQPLGQRLLSHNRFNLLSFHDADHGDGRQAPLAWLDTLLQREGITDADGEVWLHCFPRVLGYVFNPVSFWFCERRDGVLRAIVCEVNNTFGERHCYLLAHEDGSPLAWGEELQARKVFHVSPFCRVEGRYRFRFMHQLRRMPDGQPRLRHLARIDYDDGQGALLLTSLGGHAVPLGTAALWSAFVRMPLLTLAVIARIHWQALRLWRKRLPLFDKPQPHSSETSR